MICRRCEKDIPEIRQAEAAADEPKTGKQAAWEAAFEEARQNAKTFRMEPETKKEPEKRAEEPKRTERPEPNEQPQAQPRPQAQAKHQEQPHMGAGTASFGEAGSRTQRKSAEESSRRAGAEASSGEPVSAEMDRLATLSLIFGVLSVASVVFPYAVLPFACAAAACGFLGRKSAKKGSATAGLVIGVIMIALGIVLMICLSALSPYLEELTEAFTTYMQSAQ